MDRAISVRLSEEELNRLDEFAEKNQRKRTQVIRLAIEAYTKPKPE